MKENIFADIKNENIEIPEGKTILYPPTINWRLEWQRPQQILKAFSNQGYISIFCDNADRNEKETVFKYSDNFYVCTNQYFKNHCKDRKDTIIYLTMPNTFGYKTHLKNPIIWYDIIDHEKIFEHVPNFAIDHKKAIYSADFVTATAKTLMDKTRKIREDIIYMPNACDWDYFSQNHLNGRKTGRVGFVGCLGGWLDYKLIYNIIKDMQDIQFLFVGRIYAEPIYDIILKLRRFKNFRYLGIKNYNELLKIYGLVDAMIIPFKLNDVTDDVSPIKMFEYLAGGMPVISTNFKEIQQDYPILIANNEIEFKEKIIEGMNKDSKYRNELKEYAKQESWNERIKPIIEKIKETKIIIQNSYPYNFFKEILMNKEIKKVIYPPHIKFDWLKRRPHHILNILSQNGYIAFFGDVNKSYAKNSMRKYKENYFVYPEDWNDNIFNGKNSLIYLTSPYYGDKIKSIDLKSNKLWYDIIDDKNNFSWIEDFENRKSTLLKHASFVTCVSEGLYKANKKSRRDIKFIPNGVDYDFFKDVQRCSYEDAMLNIGLIGSLANWIDYDLLRYILKELNCINNNFVITVAGDYYDDYSRNEFKNILDEYGKNIIYLGRKKYEDLKEVYSMIDVGIIPFKINDISNNSSPLKMYEYLACGIPVVTTDFKEMKNKPVFESEDYNDFVNNILIADSMRDNTKYIKNIKKYAKKNSWQNRFDSMRKLLR
jgi:hypothetical protein